MGASYVSAKVNRLDLKRVFDAVIDGEVEEASGKNMEEFFRRKPRFDEVKDVAVGDRGRSAIELKKGGYVFVAKTIKDKDIDKYRRRD